MITREAAILRRVARSGHPNIVPLLDSGEKDGLPWVAAAWVSGGTLSERSNEHWDLARITRLIHSLAEGLSHLHALGVVHADVCPANIGFDDECPVLLDFGAATEVWDAKTEGRSERHVVGLDASLIDCSKTLESVDAGTIGYVAPERLLGQAWDTRADIYSLACIWYELITGKPVFASDNEAGLSRQHLSAAPLAPSLQGVSLPPDLERLLLRCLAKEPHDRTPRAADVAESLRHHLALPPPTMPEGPIIFRSRLHGRAGAIATLRARLTSTKSGMGGLLIVGGASGCGKTRLQATARTLAEELGLACLSSTAREAVRDLPIASAERELACFAAPLGLLAKKLTHTPLPDAVLTELAPLAAFDDELRAQLPSTDPVVSDTAFQGLVFDALVRAFALLATEQPLFIGLDDAQFADALTLRFLQSDSIARLRQLPVLLVIGWNTSRADLLMSGHADALHLGPLSLALTGEMLRDLLGVGSVDPSLVDLVQRATQGSPLAISEFVTAAARERLWSRSGESWTLAETGESSQPLVDRIRARVATLPTRATHLAGLAAVLGEEFSLSELSRLNRDSDDVSEERDPRELDSVMEALLVHRIVVPAGPGAYRFAHGIYREACEDLLDLPQRRDLHRTLANRLAVDPSAGQLQKRIGLHHAAAGDSDACITPLRRAARAAVRVHAIEDAIRLLELAWRHAWRADEPTELDERAARTGWDLLRLLMRAAEHQRLRELGEGLLHGLPKPSLLRARVMRLLAFSHRVTGDYARASALLDISTAELERSSAPPRPSLQRELLEHGIMRVSVHYSLREFAAAGAVLRELRPLVRAAAGPSQRAKVYMWQANVIALRSNYAFSRRAVAYERRAVAEHSRKQTLSEEYVMSQFDLAFMLLLGGPAEWPEATRTLEEAHTLAERLNDAVLTCRVVTYRAVAARRNSNESACEDFARVALGAAVSTGLRGYVGAAHACLGWAALRRGDDTRAEENCNAAVLAWNGNATPPSPLARNCYPFQWLALLPLLAVRINAERVEECEPLLRILLDASQARLRRPLTRKLALAAERWAAASERERLDSLDACLRSAAKYRYI
jgi:hypothetical protein